MQKHHGALILGIIIGLLLARTSLPLVGAKK